MIARTQALDLFCCAGGASMGLHLADFEVLGVDLYESPRYPFRFSKANALDFPFPTGVKFIWASPPCQRFSDLAKRNRNAWAWPDLIAPIRSRLRKWAEQTQGLYVIENVEGAPLQGAVTLCGTMFPGLRVLRHRKFEANFTIIPPRHGAHPLVHTFDRRKHHFGCTDENTDFVQVTGGGNSSLAAASSAMEINWMNKKEINEAVPPAYAEFIGRAALKILEERANDASASADES